MGFDDFAYRARIGLPQRPQADLIGLTQIQLAQLSAIPFENLDPLTGNIPDLAQEALWDKLVMRGRGGYCFELNGLFGQALEAYGFKAQPIMARVRNGAPQGGARSHMAFIVTISGTEYLADCGFGGGAPILPMRLQTDDVQEIRCETYRVRIDTETNEEVVERLVGDDWYSLYGFDRARVQPIDFEAANFVTARWEKAPFPNNLMMAIVTREGRNTLFNKTLKISENGENESRRIESFSEFRSAMTGKFALPDDEVLLQLAWQRLTDK